MADDFDTLLETSQPEPSEIWPEIASTASIAALLGVTTRTVTELAQKGVISRAGRGLFPVAESVRGYVAHLREQAAGRTASATLTDERTRLAREQADKVAMANAVARGEMLPARQVQSEWASILRDVRAGLLAVASRCGSNLPHLTQHDVASIDAEIRSALEALADGN